jgi:aspartate aminotransferase-like enzyme
MSYPRRKLIMLPGPTNVPDRVTNAMIKAMINHRSETFTGILKGITEKAKRLFQTQDEAIVLSASGTGGVEAAVWNIVRPGDNVVIPVFGEFSQRMAEAIELAGGHAVRVSADLGKVPSLEQIKEAVEKTKDLKAVYVVHNETSTGCTIPYTEQLGKIARDRGAFYVVDAISSLGGYAIPVDRWGVDICITGSQKCLAAPPGLALLSMSKKAVDFVKKNPPRVRYFDLARQLDFLAHGETPFTPAIPLYYALEEALSMLMEEGLEKRVERHSKCSATLYSTVAAMGLKTFCDPSFRSNTVVAALYPDGIDDGKFRKQLTDEHDAVIAGGFAHLKGKLFRIGCMGEVSSAHVHRTAAAMVLTFGKLGYPVEMKKVVALLNEGAS